MKKSTKILSLILSATLLLSTAAACKDKKKETKLPDTLAEYLDSGLQFDYFGYSSIKNGNFSMGTSTYYVGYSMINEYYINQFYDSGMVILQPQSMAPANIYHQDPEYHNSSTLKYVLDTVHALGKDHSVLITDNCFYMAYSQAKAYADANKLTDHRDISIISPDGETIQFEGQYLTEADLDADVEKWLSIYKDHPAFAGIMLQDEPPAKMLGVMGDLYKAVRRVEAKLKAAGELAVDEIMINANLLPYYPGLVKSSFPEVEEEFSPDEQQRNHEAYRRYVQYYLDATDAKHLQIDIYPMIDTGVYRKYIINLQIAAEEAKKHGAKLVIVNQSTTYGNERIMSMEDLTYLNNILMGFGVDNIGYYTYFTADGNESYVFNDWGSFVSRYGDVTDLYYRMQKINAIGQTFAPVVRSFDYKTSKTYVISTEETPLTCYSDHMMIAENYEGKVNFEEFTKLTSFEVDKEMAIVTELYDKDKDNYMYMFFNSVDPMQTGSASYETMKATFSKEYTHVWLWKQGEYTIEKLDKKKSISFQMHPGEAYFAIPFKA